MKRLWIALIVTMLPVLRTVAEERVVRRHFVDQSEAVGLLDYVPPAGMAAGLAAADYDDDGDIDLFVPNGAGVPDQLYRNTGQGHFEEVATEVGLARLQRSTVALWVDIDNDGLLDLLVGSDCSRVAALDPGCSMDRTLWLYHQDDPNHFTDITDAAGLSRGWVDTVHFQRGGMAAGDLNNDGFLDLVIGLWRNPGNGQPSRSLRILLNQADGTFRDADEAMGLIGTAGGHWQSVLHDFDRDGWIDIYAAVDFYANELWLNRSGSAFEEVAAAAGLDNHMNDMGVALGDFDNDLDLDVYVTNSYVDIPFLQITKHNVLLRNESTAETLSFREMADAAGVSWGGWGWGCTFLDYDNDGWLDLAATNGFDLATVRPADHSVFYANTGDPNGRFVDVSAEVGFDDTLWGSALVAFDADRDGWPDLAQVGIGPAPLPNRLRFLRNQPVDTNDPNHTGGHYLIVRPRMETRNRRAIGALVEVVAGSTTQVRLISAGCSLLGQEPAEACFGLGSAETVDEVRVVWPGGLGVSVRRELAVDQVVTVAWSEPMTSDTESR